MLSKEQYPYLSLYYIDRDLDRHRTYYLQEEFVDEFEFLTDPEEYAKYVEEYPDYAMSEEDK